MFQNIQKKNPLYNKLREQTVWSFGQFSKYLTEEVVVPTGWSIATLEVI